MIHEVGEKLVEEAQRFRLVFACEHCVAFDPDTGRCSLGYPNAEHRADPPLALRRQLTFCKEFEAG